VVTDLLAKYVLILKKSFQKWATKCYAYTMTIQNDVTAAACLNGNALMALYVNGLFVAFHGHSHCIPYIGYIYCEKYNWSYFS